MKLSCAAESYVTPQGLIFFYLHDLLNIAHTKMDTHKLPYFSIDNAHLMYNAHPKLMYTAVYRACSFFTNLDLFCIDNALVIYRKIR